VFRLYKIFSCLHGFLLILLILYTVCSSAQEIIPLHSGYIRDIEKCLNKKDADFHTSSKPYITTFIPFDTDSVLLINRTDEAGRSLLHRKLRYENLLVVDTDNFHLTIDPLFNFEYIYEKDNENTLYNNTRGIVLKGKVGENLAFFSEFYENQSVFPGYLTDFIKQYRIVPGQGLVKNFKESGYDYAYATGIVSYSPTQNFNFQFGHGKNFIGDGYRSLLLSDNSFNYPYLKITTNIWKLQYTNLYTSFIDMQSQHTYESGFMRKYGTIHLLSINIGRSVELSFFEGIIWQAADSTGRRGIDINYLNPVIFYRPVEFSLSSPDNAIIGMNLKYRISDNYLLYGQAVVDDLDIGSFTDTSGTAGYILNKYGYQAGIRAYDIFTVENLDLQTEYNSVRPYVYAHKTPSQNYTHYNQALAHPLGANFNESVTIVRYRYKDWALRLKFNYAVYGEDTAGSHWGKDIFVADYDAQNGFPSWGNEICQGVRTTLMYQDVRLSYLINPNTNLNAFIGFVNRTVKSDIEDMNTSIICFGIRTSLTNHYYDF